MTTIRVEGRLTRSGAHDFLAACEPGLVARRAFRVDLSGLQFADPTGVHAIRTVAGGGAELVGGSQFLHTLLGEQTARPAPVSPETDLVARLRAGDPDAFEAMVRKYGARLLAVARRLMGDEQEARDALQEGFISAFKAIDRFNGGARLSTWLHRIVVNAALMRLRSRRRRREDSIDDLLPRFEDDGHHADPVREWDEPAEVVVERAETRAVVRRAIARLPEAYRTVLMLRDIEELDTDEVARLLDMTPAAVKTRLHRARQALRTLLGRELAQPGT